MLKTTQKCTSFLILGTNTYNKLTIYLLLILISELLEYDIVKYVVLSIVCITGAYAGFLRGGWPNFKISGILDIHAAKRHVASSEAASLC